MFGFHFEIKSGRVGRAAGHASYIGRTGWHEKHGDLLFSGFGNMPGWSENDPLTFWKAADRGERSNGATYREMVIALPNWLNLEQQRALVDQLVAGLVGCKPYHYAVHAPVSSLQGEVNTHVHLMYSDRIPDGIDRSADQFFSRYNSRDPLRGGRRKGSGGLTKMQLRDELIATREMAEIILNEHIALSGVPMRVDHRTLKEQGKNRQPERHLGPAWIKKMSEEEKRELTDLRC